LGEEDFSSDKESCQVENADLEDSFEEKISQTKLDDLNSGTLGQIDGKELTSNAKDKLQIVKRKKPRQRLKDTVHGSNTGLPKALTANFTGDFKKADKDIVSLLKKTANLKKQLGNKGLSKKIDKELGKVDKGYSKFRNSCASEKVKIPEKMKELRQKRYIKSLLIYFIFFTLMTSANFEFVSFPVKMKIQKWIYEFRFALVDDTGI
jgi:hypothetical protein